MSQLIELEEFLKEEALKADMQLLKFKVWNGLGKLHITLVVEHNARETTFEDCFAISKFASMWLKNHNLISKSNLSVEAPGIDRELYTLQDFERFSGKMVHIETKELVHDKRNFKGFIKQVKYDLITIENNDFSYEIKFDSIKKAKLIPNWDEIMKKAKL